MMCAATVMLTSLYCPGEVAAVAGPGPSQDQGTRAISVQQLSLGAVGDCSVWEFSGCERYHLTYDHFIGNTNCIHVVMFSLADPPAVQLDQVTMQITVVGTYFHCPLCR